MIDGLILTKLIWYIVLMVGHLESHLPFYIGELKLKVEETKSIIKMSYFT